MTSKNRSRKNNKYIVISLDLHTFSRSARSIFAPVPNSLRSRSALLNDDEYFGKVGGGIGRAAIAGFSSPDVAEDFDFEKTQSYYHRML